MNLKTLINGLSLRVGGNYDGAQLITGVTIDSRTVQPGMVFIGEQFFAEAVSRGASCIISESAVPHLPASCTNFLCDNQRQMAAYLCERFSGYPSRSLAVCGVTGTNGKTTVSFILAHILKYAGHRAGILGTLGFGDMDAPIATGFTTPECEQLSNTLATMLKQGFSHVCMEVSSHALASFRADGVKFGVAGFTNLTQDHLDYHLTMAHYEAAKNRLFFDLLHDQPAILPFGHKLSTQLSRVITWGLLPEATVSATNLQDGQDGMSFILTIGTEHFSVASRLIGRHNVENQICAAAMAFGIGIAPSDIAAALTRAIIVPGRLQPIEAPPLSGPKVYVDFAHTPDALEKVLKTLRPITKGKLTVIFGCGGNRDSEKRKKMGHIAAQLADKIYVSDDNPRWEKSIDIISQIAEGITEFGHTNYTLISDRKEAICCAIKEAQPEDLVLIAGKGCENTQEICGTFSEFSDAELAREALHGRLQ